MKIESLFNKTMVAGALTAIMSACSHGPVVRDFPDTANGGDEVRRLDVDMTAAAGNQVNVLAPRSFEAAHDATEDAKRDFDKQKEPRRILHEVAEARAYLDRANEFAKISQSNMEEVADARKKAETAGAGTFLPEQFGAADQKFKGVTANVEKNDLSDIAQKRGELQAIYLDLELRSIKRTALGPSREVVALAVKENAKDFAPRSLAIAEKNVADTDAYITANRHETDQIKSRSGMAFDSANHLLKITRDSKAGKKESSEDAALQMESEQGKVADKQVQLSDQRDQLASKDVQLTQEQTKLSAEQGATRVLEAKNANLENDQAFNDSFEAARAKFTKGEAEVYKQGNTLVIRLRGLEFPASQALLAESNFPLLAKVQQVIKDFGNDSVVVQGHTDSRGGKVLNEKLSTERAQAVRTYLISNDASGLKPVNITAIGYGFQMPLASNKTPEGRAQNRRVDVLIERLKDTGTN